MSSRFAPRFTFHEDRPMTFAQWSAHVPETIKADTLWRVEAYRLALYLSDFAWADGAMLLGDRRTLSIADQLCRAAGNISSNISEGYSRDTGRGRALFYEYALGSARETRDWYFKSRNVLPTDLALERINLVTQIIRLLLTMVSNERQTNRRASSATRPSR